MIPNKDVWNVNLMYFLQHECSDIIVIKCKFLEMYKNMKTKITAKCYQYFFILTVVGWL